MQPADALFDFSADSDDLNVRPISHREVINTHNYYIKGNASSTSEHLEICQSTVNPHYKVSMEDFQIMKCIGKGGYGKVYLVRKISDGPHKNRLFAMKVLKKAVISRTHKDMVHTWAERNILEMIRHPFLVKLHYAFQNEANLSMILEYCPGGELFTYLESVGFVSEKKASFYISEIVLAIGHLHSFGIIYRDLKPENILLDKSGHCKLTDFGLSKESCERTNTYCGTKEYMAPEIWLRKYHDKAVDWWCLGNLLYDMLAGYPPFSHDDKNILRDKILRERVEYPETFSDEVISLLDGLLKKDPTERLGHGSADVEAIKRHAFFFRYNISWEDVLLKRLEPPYKPFLKSETDTSQFDPNFTGMDPIISPVDGVTHDLFKGFSYVGSGVAESVFKENGYDRYRRRTPSNVLGDGVSSSLSTMDTCDEMSKIRGSSQMKRISDHAEEELHESFQFNGMSSPGLPIAKPTAQGIDICPKSNHLQHQHPPPSSVHLPTVKSTPGSQQGLNVHSPIPSKGKTTSKPLSSPTSLSNDVPMKKSASKEIVIDHKKKEKCLLM